MIVGLILSTAINCTGGVNPQTIAANNKIREIIALDVEQYQSCLTDEDCTFLPRVDGYVLNKNAISIVNNCADRLQVALFPHCYVSGRNRIGDTVLMAPLESYPDTAVCEKNKCAKSSGKRRNWSKENLATFKKLRTLKTDDLCQGFLDSIKKDSNSKK